MDLSVEQCLELIRSGSGGARRTFVTLEYETLAPSLDRSAWAINSRLIPLGPRWRRKKTRSLTPSFITSEAKENAVTVSCQAEVHGEERGEKLKVCVFARQLPSLRCTSHVSSIEPSYLVRTTSSFHLHPRHSTRSTLSHVGQHVFSEGGPALYEATCV